jgi:large subunit ribosomal protein L25
MTTLEMYADLRHDVGGSTSRNLIRQGKVPAIVYGNSKPNLSISLDMKEITKLFHSGYLTSTTIDLKLKDQDEKHTSHKTLIKEIQLDPVKDTVRHVDLVFLNPLGQEVAIPLVFENKDKCIGVKRGGFFNIMHRKIKLFCSPDNIPQQVNFNVLNMRIGQKLLASQIPLPEGTKLAMKDNAMLVSIIGRGKADKGDESKGEGEAPTK